jgi:hypothetical protein
LHIGVAQAVARLDLVEVARADNRADLTLGEQHALQVRRSGERRQRNSGCRSGYAASGGGSDSGQHTGRGQPHHDAAGAGGLTQNESAALGRGGSDRHVR